MATTSEILRATASLIEEWAVEKGHRANHAPIAIRWVAGQLTSTEAQADALAKTAMRTLATHLTYGPDRDPETELTRWSRLRTPQQVIHELRAAADAAERNER